MKLFKAFLVFVAICFIITGLFYLILEDKSQPEASDPWIRSSLQAPPLNTLIDGIWIEGGQPVSVLVVAHGIRYFEYDALHPKGPTSPLFDYPPVWWIEMPGVVR